uniref:ZP domain-containing protein n=1 Tax=Plectus sambesii TaxID=2011161 RepID=A0A914WM63_9BILA
MYRKILTLLAVLTACGATPIDNGVVDSTVQCSADSIKVVFKTRNPFQGRIFVKGNVDKDECKHSYTDDVASQSTNPEISFMFGDCNMQRARRLAPQRGMMQSIVVIISFHRIFLTKVDRAYKIQCFYMEADKILTASLDVSMLTTTNLEDTAGMPMCKYTVRSGSRDGPETKYATVGSATYHEWECESTTHNILVKNCVVDNGKDEKHDIIDSRGCAIDPVIMPDLTYDTTGNAKAYVESHAFKFADQPTVFFQCVVQLCNKGEPECDTLTPPPCTPGYTRSPIAGNPPGVTAASTGGEEGPTDALGVEEGETGVLGGEEGETGAPTGEGGQTGAPTGEGEQTGVSTSQEGQTGTPVVGLETTGYEAGADQSGVPTGSEGSTENPADAEETITTISPARFGFRRKTFQFRAKRNAAVLASREQRENRFGENEMDLMSNSFIVLDLEDSPNDIEHLSERNRFFVASDVLPELTGGGDTQVCLSPSGFGILLTMVTTVFVVSATVAICFFAGKFRVEDMKIA